MEDGKSCSVPACSMTPCEKKKVLIGVIAAFITMVAFNWLYHGVYMKEAYEATASLWRTQEEMESLMWLCFVRQFFMAAVFTCLFWCVNKNIIGVCCPIKGAKFGGKIGLLLGLGAAGSYIYMPIPQSLAIQWLVGETIMGALMGAVLSLVWNRCSKTNA